MNDTSELIKELESALQSAKREYITSRDTTLSDFLRGAWHGAYIGHQQAFTVIQVMGANSMDFETYNALISRISQMQADAKNESADVRKCRDEYLQGVWHGIYVGLERTSNMLQEWGE